MTARRAALTSGTDLHLFGSKLFSLLIAALVLVGYSEVLCGSCSFESVAVASETGEPSHSHSDSDHGDDAACQCICHQSFLNPESTARFEPVLLTMLSLILERADYPPDAVPLGIEHPPQLA